MEFMSESTTDGKSFGLLDEHLLQDLTLNNSEKFNNVKEKPPIPSAKKKSISDSLKQTDYNDLYSEQQQNGDPAEETVVSIQLNESDLKELEDEFTFDDDDDEDEDPNSHKQNDQTLNKSPLKRNDNHNTKRDAFSSLINKDIYQSDFLLNESADILRNSNEFIKNNSYTTTNIMNYDAMDDLNANNETKQVNMTTNNDLTVNSLAECENNNITVNFANESSTERINQLVMQSVERFKRRYNGTSFTINSNEDLFNNSPNNLINNKDKQDRRFSASTIKTLCTKMYNMSTTTNFDDNLEQINQSMSFSANIEINIGEQLKETQIQQDAGSMSIYFKPSNSETLNETEFKADNQQSASFIFGAQVVQNDQTNNSMFGTHIAELSICKQQNNKDFLDLNENEFKSGTEFLSDLKQDELQNRKEFASNELSVLATTTDESRMHNETSSGSDTSVNINKDKWWKRQETSKLEQSKAQDYFESNSSFPSFLANRDPETSYSMLKNKNKKSDPNVTKVIETKEIQQAVSVEQNTDETICEEKTKHEESQHANSNDEDITFSTTKNQLSGNASNNFSFTLNASENGDFIIKKQTDSSQKTESTTPFQVSKMLSSYQAKKQVTASNLKTIGEELDRVQNRLASSNTSDQISKTTTITTTTTTQADTEKSNIRHKNNQLILTMDETISSINSSSNRTTNLVRQQNSKQKVASGSLTSTPSKLKKGEKSLTNKSDEMTTTSNNLLNQESFMSSIPERVNDSTLVGNHHHHYQANKKVAKNAEIQTSPDKTRSSGSSTSSFSSASAVDPPSKLLVAEEKAVASQMVHMAASLLSNNISNPNDTNSNRTSLFNSSNNNGLIPVAFLPVDAVFPYVQKMYDNYQQKSQIDISCNSLSSQQRQASGMFTSLSNDYSSPHTLNQMTNKQYKFELPQLELDKKVIDFGHIAEGCYDTCRLFIKLTNTNLINLNTEHNIASNLHIELDTYKDWSIEQYNKNDSFKLDESSLKSKLSKTLGLNFDKKQSSELKSSLKLEFVTNYYELFIHLNTSDLNYFKEILYQQQTDSHDDEEDKSSCLEPLQIGTNLSIYYCFMDNNNMRKYLLNRIDLKYVLGYARLRSTVNINLIEFDLSLFSEQDANVSKSNRSTYNDNDKTLTSNCSKDESALIPKYNKNLDQLIPLSNAGNISINVNCYFVNENLTNNDLDEDEEENKFRVLNLKSNQFQLRIDKSVINLESKSKSNNKKQITRLTLVKLIEQMQLPSFDDLNIRLILQVKPNGFKYEIPIKFKLAKIPSVISSKLKKVNSLDSSSTYVAKIASSKSIIFFGKTLNSNVKTADLGLVNEFVIRNLNDHKVHYDLSLVTCLNEQSTSCFDDINLSTNSTASSTFSEKNISKSSINLFKFTTEMKEQSLKEDPSMTRIIVELEPKQNATIRIKFNSSLVESDKNNQVLNCFGLVKISTIGFNQKFNVFLVGFLNRSQLSIDSNENKLFKKSDLPQDNRQDNFKLEKQLFNKNLQLFNFNYQLLPNTSLNDDFCFVFKKPIKIHNKSLNSRLFVYPVLFDSKENTELQSISISDNEILYDLGLRNDGFDSRFRIYFDQNKVNHANQLTWIDLQPNEVLTLQIDIELKMEKSILNNNITRKKLIEYYEKIDKKFEQFNLCLFWVESDINVQCLNGIQFLNTTTSDLDSASFIDSFMRRLLSRQLSKTKASYMDMSYTPYFVNSIITKKAKLQYDNMLNLMQQALKCSIIKMNVMFKVKTRNDEHQSFDYSVNTSSSKMQHFNEHSVDQSSLLNDTAVSLNESKLRLNSQRSDEAWSLLNDSIVINSLKFDHVSNYTSRIIIRNNSKKELIFNVAFNSACLDIEPNRGTIQALRTLDLLVKIRKEVANKLPWHGIITIICNKTEKDVKVSLYSQQLNTSKLSNSKIISSASSSSLNSNKVLKAPPAPIQSLTLPVQSVKIKSNTDLKNSINSSSSYSMTDSSPFVQSSYSTASSTSSACTTLEQGTLISEITQYTLDSLSLTPLINASFQTTASKLNQQRSLKTDINKKDDSIIKILHYGNHAQIQFPPVCVTKSKTYDFSLINPTNNFVSWKAYSSKQQPRGFYSSESSHSKNVFKMTPSSGIIQANQRQNIKIEFSPRDEFGNIQELWEIDTKTSTPFAYNCKLVISGKSIANDEEQFNVLGENNSQRSFKSTSNLSKYKTNSVKENNDPSNLFKREDESHHKTLSEYDQTSESNKSGVDCDYSSMFNRKIIIKTDPVVFADTKPGDKSKSYIVIDNKEDKPCNLNIISLMDPFYCKHLSFSIDSKHYIKVPIEFKPQVQGDYTEKVLIRIDSNEMPLTCIVKAKCVPPKGVSAK